MNKNRVRINLDVSSELAEKIKALAIENDISVNALIRLAIQYYIKNN